MRNEYEIEHCMRCINNALPDVAIGCGVKFTYPPSSLPLVIISAFVPTVSNFQLPRPDSFAMENLSRGSLYFCIPARTRAAIPRSTQSRSWPAWHWLWHWMAYIVLMAVKQLLTIPAWPSISSLCRCEHRYLTVWWCCLSGCHLSLTGLSRLSAHESGTTYRPNGPMWRQLSRCLYIPPAAENSSLFEIIPWLFPGHYTTFPNGLSSSLHYLSHLKINWLIDWLIGSALQ